MPRVQPVGGVGELWAFRASLVSGVCSLKTGPTNCQHLQERMPSRPLQFTITLPPTGTPKLHRSPLRYLYRMRYRYRIRTGVASVSVLVRPSLSVPVPYRIGPDTRTDIRIDMSVSLIRVTFRKQSARGL